MKRLNSSYQTNNGFYPLFSNTKESFGSKNSSGGNPQRNQMGQVSGNSTAQNSMELASPVKRRRTISNNTANLQNSTLPTIQESFNAFEVPEQRRILPSLTTLFDSRLTRFSFF